PCTGQLPCLYLPVTGSEFTPTPATLCRRRLYLVLTGGIRTVLVIEIQLSGPLPFQAVADLPHPARCEVRMSANLNPADSGFAAWPSLELNRRAVLKTLAAAGALAVPGLGIAGCGGSAAPNPKNTTPQIKKGGTLRVALTGGSSADT